MKISRLLIACLALTCAFLAGCTSGPEELETTPDITLAELERKMLKARDPEGVFKQAKSYVQKQVIKVGRVAYLMEVKYQSPDCFRITTIKNNQPESAIILNGENGWQVDYVKEEVTPILGENLFRLKTMNSLTNPSESYQSLFAQVVLSMVKMDGNEYYKMVCTAKLPDHPEMILYIGKNSFLLRRIVIPSLKYTSTIQSYALYEGVMVAQETEITVGNRSTYSKIIENKLNTEIDPSEFVPPVFGPAAKK